MRSPTRLLSGVQVLDLTNVLAGPFCTYQLALQGADVLKVEMPVSGDLARQLGADPALNHRGTGSSFLAQNAGKRSLTLNLKDERGKAILAELAEDADVLVENFRPGVLASLGFGWDELRSRNAGLVYCAISGFGADIGGQEPERMGNDNFTASPSGAFATADGLLNIAANQQGQFVALCDAVGRPDLAIDVRFAERADRLVNRPALNAELTAALAARPATEWEVLLNPLGVPAARVLSIPEVVELDQLEHRQLVAEVGTVPGTDRPLRVVTAGFHVDGRAARPSTAPPVLGADVDHELARLGRSSAEISRLRSEGVL